MNNDLMFSSKHAKWDTPKSLVDDLAAIFNWDWDVCASTDNVCHFYFDQTDNGLECDWEGLCWMNPPYGREIGKWVDKARQSAGSFLDETAVVCLVPARTDTKWWHDNVPFASLVVFIKGRLKFGNATNSAPFPSAFVVFGQLEPAQVAKLSSYGISYRKITLTATH